ncbi:MAG: glycoside hydrolase family 3 C-terminal domain-containing protein [Acidobacteriaceae bacterium]
MKHTHSQAIPQSSHFLRSSVSTALALCLTGAIAQQPKAATDPWMDPALPPEQRAHLAVQAMTLDEKIQLVHGSGWGVLRAGAPVLPGHNGGAGFVPGIPRLHIPDINLADSAVGARMAARESRYATLLPSVLGLAATWDPEAGFLYGDVIGRELRDQGYNMSIGGGANLMREPRNGRNFEYAGEDPLLAGVEVGNLIRGVQSNHIMGDLKHYALNDQETDRNTLNVLLGHREMRETDLLAFEIANRIGQPTAVMCSYNRIEGDYACENDYTLNKVLKHDFGFKGFVLSDWNGTHSTVKAALAGLDMEQPGTVYFGEPLKHAVESGEVPAARLDDMVTRILRSLFVSGAVDDLPARRVVDPFRGRKDAAHIAEEGIVLLQNRDAALPLSKTQTGLIAVIGSHADVGVLSGGGSAQVDSPGGNAINIKEGASVWGRPVYFPSAPLEFIRQKTSQSTVQFDSGDDPKAAAALAAKAAVAIVFVHQWMSEGQDAATLSLPEKQDALVEAVASANKKTVVVLESGGPVSMPWAPRVSAILAAWYPGIGGGESIANLLFGDVNPSGKLPATFARQETDLPNPHVPGLTEKTTNNRMDAGGDAAARAARNITVDYRPEGLKVGYKWFQTEGKTPLFAFGHGLSYTTFAYSGLKVDKIKAAVTFRLQNTGDRAGDEVAQVYVTLPSSTGESFRRLVGWQRVTLAAHESKTVSITPTPELLSTFDEPSDTWKRPAGTYQVEVGAASDDLRLKATVNLR